MLRTLLTLVVVPLLPGCALVRVFDTMVNSTTVPPCSGESGVPENTRSFHRTLLVADAHADTLMLDRGGAEGIRRKHCYGHVDLPRLREGNVSFQMLTVATHTPVPYNETAGGGWFDGQELLTRAQGWPARTWSSTEQRARYQAWKWRLNADGVHFAPILTRGDIKGYLASRFDRISGDRWSPRQPETGAVASVLGLEGCHALGLREENTDAEIAGRLREFKAEGFRVLALTHRFDNPLAGGSEGKEREGLTSLGRRVLRAMQRQGFILDLAHLSPRAIDEALEDFPDLPVMVSHCGVDFHPPGPGRLLSIPQARTIARRGGVIGIGLWPEALQGVADGKKPEPTAALAAQMIASCVRAFGAGAICLGSDMDGAAKAAFDASSYALLTDALLDEVEKGHLSREELRAVMGTNLVEFFMRSLPRK